MQRLDTMFAMQEEVVIKCEKSPSVCSLSLIYIGNYHLLCPLKSLSTMTLLVV